MEAEERAKIDELLETNGGPAAEGQYGDTGSSWKTKLRRTATVLGIPKEDLLQKVQSDPYLAQKWLGILVDPNNRPEHGISMEVIENFSPMDQSIVRATMDGDKQLAAGLEVFGLKKPMIDKLHSIEKFTATNIVRTLDLAHACMVGSIFQAEELSEDIYAKLNDPSVDLASDRGRILFALWKDASVLKQKFNDSATRAGHIRVIMEATARDAVERQNKKVGRPGFGPARPVNPKDAPAKVIEFDPSKPDDPQTNAST